MADYDHTGQTPSQLPEDERKRLLDFVRNSREILSVATGSVLFQEGNPCCGCYYVEEGELLLTINSGERQLTIGSAKTGHLLAVASVIGNCEHRYSAQTLRDSHLTFIPAEEMRDYLRQRSDVCLSIVERLGAELLELTEHAIRPLRLHPKAPKHQET